MASSIRKRKRAQAERNAAITLEHAETVRRQHRGSELPLTPAARSNVRRAVALLVAVLQEDEKQRRRVARAHLGKRTTFEDEFVSVRAIPTPIETNRRKH